MKKGKNRRELPNGGDGDDVSGGDSRNDDETTINSVPTTAPTTTRDGTFSSMITTVHSSTSTSVTSRTTPLLSTGEIPTSTFAMQSVPPRDTQGPNVVILVTLPAVLLVVIVLLVIWSIRKKSIVRLQQRRNPVYPTDSDGVNMKGMEGASPADQYEEVNENITEATESSTKKTAEMIPFYQTLEPDKPALNGVVTSHKDVAYDQVDREAHSRMIDNEDINRAAGNSTTSLVSPSYDKLKRTEGKVNDSGEANSNNSSNQNLPHEEYEDALLRRAEYNHTVPAWYDKLNATNSGSGISYDSLNRGTLSRGVSQGDVIDANEYSHISYP
ncbi:hypothetical protein BSL78_10946 [Apostichopus japonicus]|uniref:Uncharacterized protein n=1 Tax=Stichopus japonicus TaxID=307972 RepID=A0A2G8KVY3_STIJA|nr:hypothetical protein BSL78_10946 [Apostichopus japonicus]